MNTTASPGPVMEALGSITFYAIKMKPLIPTYIHLIISSVFPIYAAAHASLRRPVSAAPVKKKKHSQKHSRDEESDSDESSSPVETLTAYDAILFPVLAGCTLTGLYLLIKWLEDPKLLNQLLGYYFSWIGIFFCFKFVKDVLYFTRSWIFPSQFSWNGKLYKFDEYNNCFYPSQVGGADIKTVGQDSLAQTQSRLPPWFRRSYMDVRKKAIQEMNCVVTIRKPFTPLRLSLPATWLDAVAGLTSIFIAFHTTLGIKTPWYLTNLQGFAFCYGSLQYMSPGTSAVGSLLLSLLFFYDIYMVFYTPMMVTVATKLDVPIKLLFPKSVDGVKAMAMLGLGDIVVPGIIIAFALRFDLYRHYARMNKNDKKTGAKSDLDDNKENQQDARPTYTSARGSWAERTYTAKTFWSPTLHAKAFPKPYFTATLTGYILGMITTVLVMTVFDHAQPALLYLVPGVLLSFWGTALVKGDLKLAWIFDEAEEEKEKEKKEEEKRKAKEAEKKNTKGDDKPKETLKSAEETEVESGLKPFLTFNIYLPRRPTVTPAHTTERQTDNPAPDPLPQGKQETLETKLEDAETESEASTDSSTTSSAELVSQEEALEAESVNASASLKEQESVIVSTRDDEGGAQAVKRRRRG